MKTRPLSKLCKWINNFLLLQDAADPAAQSRHWKLSALRIILVFGLLLESTIFLQVSWEAAKLGLYDIIGMVLFFFVVLSGTLYLTSRSLRIGAWSLILTIYAAGACILTAISVPEIAKLGPIFVYSAPLIALILFGHRVALALMALNILPFALLLRNQPVPNILQLSATLDDTHIHIQSLIFLFFNIGIPLAFSRVMTALHQATRKTQTMNHELEASLAIHENVFEYNGSASLFCTASGTVVRCNRLAARLLGGSREQIEGLNLSGLLKDTSGDSSQDKVSATLTAHRNGIRQIRANGKPVLLQITPMADTGNLLVALRDRSEIEQLRAELNNHLDRVNYLSCHDGLTNLPNRAHFIEILSNQINETQASEQQLAVINIKIRDLRTVNELYGIENGDTLINLIGHSIQQNLTGQDRLGRTRGGAFSLLLADIPYGDANISERILNYIHQLPRQHAICGQMLEISYFTGAAVFPQDAGNAQDLIRFSELAQHSARIDHSGEPVYFDQGQADAMRRRIDVEVGLRMALREHRLELHYQPKVNFIGKLCGMEALLRWHSPELGTVSPAEFIPVAEKAGLVHDITLLVIEMAIHQINIWQKSGLPLCPIAINLSAIDLSIPTLVEEILARTNLYDLPVNLLEFEITETALMTNGEIGLQNLNLLQKIGFRISIDDFGSGYSSLSKMAHLPVYAIKIDREFVQGIPGDSRREKIVDGILSLAHSLELTVIAEGVENTLQLDFLHARNCHLYQGYHFHRPLPIHEAEALLFAMHAPEKAVFADN